MSTEKKEKDILNKYFEEKTSLLDQLKNNNNHTSSLNLQNRDKPKYPTLPVVDPADEADTKKFWKELRAFFRRGGNDNKAGLKKQIASAHFAGMGDQGYIPMGFPLWLASENTFEKNTQTTECVIPVSQLIDGVMKGFEESKPASILKDNLLRFQVLLSGLLSAKDDPVPFAETIEEAAKQLIDNLSISGSEGDEFQSDLMSLVNRLPQDGFVIPYSSKASFFIFTTTLKAIFFERKKQLREEVRHLERMLKDLIMVDDQNRPEAYDPSKLTSSYQFASQLINFDELSGIMPESASEAISEERLTRIKNSVNILSKVEEVLFKDVAAVVVSNHLQKTYEYDWDFLFEGCEVIKAEHGQGCPRAIEEFNKRMSSVTEVFRAIRIGQLELKRAYDPELHDEFFAHFDWRSFSEHELNACPLIILLEDSEVLIEKHLKSFFDILKSDIPVKTVAIKEMSASEFQAKSDTAVNAMKQELASLAISHRNAYVMQTAAVDPEFLYRGFQQGLSEYSPGLFHILLPEAKIKQNDSYLWISAAVEGRGFPAITYDQQKGAQWGSRFDIGNNPSPNRDWPVHQLTITTEKDEESTIDIPFTYADFASLDPSYQKEFLIVPPEYWSDELVLLSEYLNIAHDQLYSSIPFIWMVSEANQLQKVAVSWALATACRERLEFWHFIQESCGSKSYHIDQAVHKALQEASDKFLNELSELKQSHQNEIKEVEEEAAAKTMKRLAEILLDLDTTSESIPRVSSETTSTEDIKVEAVAKETSEVPAKEEQVEEEDDEDMSLGEPWIDSALCTTCNECIDLNNRMFSYNENKQAYLKDPKAGTFLELVTAAENCPPKIIHPGAPLNPNEEGLEELIKRAEPFN